MGLVLVSYKEKLKGTAPAGEDPMYDVVSGKDNGFTINLAVGTQYAMGGRMRLFADAGIALPANSVNGQYVENVIPSHFMFNAGVRFSLGTGSDY